MKILLLFDPPSAQRLQSVIQASTKEDECQVAFDPRAALVLIQGLFVPDILILPITVPGLTTVEFIAQARAINNQACFTPIVVDDLSGSIDDRHAVVDDKMILLSSEDVMFEIDLVYILGNIRTKLETKILKPEEVAS